MAITYTVSEYAEEDRTVEVTFENSDGLIHKRNINIPHNEDGTIDEEYLKEILEGQLRGVEYNLRIGTITFIEPTPETVGILTTP
jgi:hypothetical protein